MIKETKIKREIEETVKEYYCDDCGKKITQHFSYMRNNCNICGKLICRDCYCREEDSEDYTNVWCENCWDTIGSHYRQQIDELKRHIEALYEEWEKKCKESKK